MVSLKDIASQLNVSIATVSKALNNQPDIGDETKNMIRKKAEEMGYRPNLFARGLKVQRTWNIGVLFADEAHNGLTQDYFAAVLDSFKNAVEEQDYDVTFLNCSRSRQRKMSFLERARYRQFDGVIIACVDFSDPEILELVQSDVPVVTIDYIFKDRLAVISDNTGGMEELYSYMYRMGHRRIAYVHGEYNAVTQDRLVGFWGAARRLGVKVEKEYVRESRYRDIEGAAYATARLLDLEIPPTCILYPDDFAAFGGLNEIRRRGLLVPGDISVAGYDGIRLVRHMFPQMTTLRQDTACIGRTAARKLIELIEHPETAQRDITVVKGALFEGQTVAAMDVNYNNRSLS